MLRRFGKRHGGLRVQGQGIIEVDDPSLACSIPNVAYDAVVQAVRRREVPAPQCEVIRSTILVVVDLT